MVKQLLGAGTAYHKETHGNYEKIFPFSKASEACAVALNRAHTDTTESTNGLKQPRVFTVKGPNYMKELVSLVRKWEHNKLMNLSRE